MINEIYRCPRIHFVPLSKYGIFEKFHSILPITEIGLINYNFIESMKSFFKKKVMVHEFYSNSTLPQSC